jgi:methionyl aminopeptidase
MSLNDEQRIAAMREGGQRLARVLQSVIEAVRPGVTTGELDVIAEKGILAAGGTPSFKGYNGYPASLCTSVNEGVVHGIPRDDWKLNEGDIVGLDIGMVYDGAFTDTAFTVGVGSISAQAQQLIVVAREALRRGLRLVRAGVRTGEVGAAIQKHVEAAGFGIVRDLVGHGVGNAIHEDPQVPNFGPAKSGEVLRAGQTIAVEPMVTAGNYAVRTLSDGWTVVTRDGSLAAHFEQTVAVTDKGHEILTPFPWEKSSR